MFYEEIDSSSIEEFLTNLINLICESSGGSLISSFRGTNNAIN